MKKQVTFQKYNLKMAGHLYTPDNMDNYKKYPALVVSHPAGGVKEQTAGIYAKKWQRKAILR
ncbi:hypothetical protein [Priestia endophytica]|uniref:hypothetical protein n=1 Tax=Priestia endophytica TaxID=135735 RepID=UPI001F5BFB6C|nr:hypothetical protein [Priestia endophytica]